MSDYNPFLEIYEQHGLEAFIKALEYEKVQTPALKAAIVVLISQDLVSRLGRS